MQHGREERIRPREQLVQIGERSQRMSMECDPELFHELLSPGVEENMPATIHSSVAHRRKMLRQHFHHGRGGMFPFLNELGRTAVEETKQCVAQLSQHSRSFVEVWIGVWNGSILRRRR